jgi:hypothetical protein
MNRIFIYLCISILVGFLGCTGKFPEDKINPQGGTIMTRIKAPEGYKWFIERPGSFESYLQNLELESAGAMIFDYKKNSIKNQFEHVAIITSDIGSKDLQQCADAIIRLRADYLWENDMRDKIAFHFTSGDLFKWVDYKNGVRPVLSGNNSVQFENRASFDDTYEAFKKYLEIIFIYAGTISLHNETTKVTDNKKIKTGDILITPGSPGHAVIVVGSAENSKGERVYLLAQGNTPAQSVHVITNPYNKYLNPWYKLDLSKNLTITAGYLFRKTNIRRFKE